jgi:hypothetical protein
MSVPHDAPVSHGAAKHQGFADKYNRHQFPLGKTRTKSSENQRICALFSLLSSGLASCGSGTFTMPTFGSMVQMGLISKDIFNHEMWNRGLAQCW